jgi:hypothetical protein
MQKSRRMPSLIIVDYPPPDQASAIEGKFVQLRLPDHEYLVLAARVLHTYHNQILAHFLADRGLPFRWFSENTLGVDVPGLTIVGGGRFRADQAARVLTLWDNSQVYGRFDEHGLPGKIAGAGHRWSGYAVRID